MDNPEKKLAILIDAENISSKYVNIIIKEAVNTGNVIYKRIYGDWTSQSLTPWKGVILDNAISPIQQFSNTNGKNSSDSALIIDAMDLLYKADIDCFCIVSSDSDFTKLASRLRESDKYVVGMGEQKTPRAFISACNKFLYLDLLFSGEHPSVQGEYKQAIPITTKRTVMGKTAKSVKDAEPATNGRNRATKKEGLDISKPIIASGKDFETVKNTIHKLVEEKSDDDGWIFSGTLGSLLNNQLPDFDVRNFGFSKLVDFVSSLNLFDMNIIKDPANPSTKHIYFKIKK
ncbi:MAG: NYN domain-containing protein [Eubacteriales bacterium]|nr:NYN domain-containing protein [Eubacteriales bacterium]